MTAEALRALSEKFRKQTEDGINAMFEANVDHKSELARLIESLRRDEGAEAPTNEPLALARSVVELIEQPIRRGSAEVRIAG